MSHPATHSAVDRGTSSPIPRSSSSSSSPSVTSHASLSASSGKAVVSLTVDPARSSRPRLLLAELASLLGATLGPPRVPTSPRYSPSGGSALAPPGPRGAPGPHLTVARSFGGSARGISPPAALSPEEEAYAVSALLDPSVEVGRRLNLLALLEMVVMMKEQDRET